MKMKKELSNNEIIDRAIELLEVKNDNQLAEMLQVERQRIHQFRKTKGDQICHKLLKAILTKIE